MRGKSIFHFRYNVIQKRMKKHFFCSTDLGELTATLLLQVCFETRQVVIPVVLSKILFP